MGTKSPDKVDIEVGERICLQRKMKGISQTTLAEGLGVTFQQVQKYEKGVNRVGAGRLAMPRVTRPESVFTLLVGDQPVLTFAAGPLREAQSITHEQWLHDDLREVCSNGLPIWDGKAKLSVRYASLEETARFIHAKEAASDGSGDLLLVYLTEIDT